MREHFCTEVQGAIESHQIAVFRLILKEGMVTQVAYVLHALMTARRTRRGQAVVAYSITARRREERHIVRGQTVEILTHNGRTIHTARLLLHHFAFTILAFGYDPIAIGRGRCIVTLRLPRQQHIPSLNSCRHADRTHETIEGVIKGPNLVRSVLVVALVAPFALHGDLVAEEGERVIEGEFQVDRGPLVFRPVGIVGTLLAFLGVTELCRSLVDAVKHNLTSRTHVAAVLIILDIVLILVADISNQAPHVVQLAGLLAIDEEIDITHKIGVVAIIVIHPKIERDFGAIVRIGRVAKTHNRITQRKGGNRAPTDEPQQQNKQRMKNDATHSIRFENSHFF